MNSDNLHNAKKSIQEYCQDMINFQVYLEKYRLHGKIVMVLLKETNSRGQVT